MRFCWLELKTLDIATNRSTEVETCREMIALGWQTRYYCGYKEFPRKIDSLPPGTVQYLFSPKWRGVRGVWLAIALTAKIADLLFRQRPAVVMLDYQLALCAAPVLSLARRLDLPSRIVLDIRTLPVNPPTFARDMRRFRWALNVAARCCHGITYITPALRDYCFDLVPALRARPYGLWSSGFAEKVFKPPAAPRVAGAEETRLFYHGGLSLSRGIGELLKAVALLRQSGKNVSLLLAGVLVDPQAIPDMIHELGLDGCCRLLPPVPYERVPALIAECDLPVIPLPDFDGWQVSSPIKLMEYLAMAKPVVATDIAAHRDILGRQPFAFYAGKGTARELADAVTAALDKKDAWPQLGALARARAVEDLSWRAQAGRLDVFLKSLISAGGRDEA